MKGRQNILRLRDRLGWNHADMAEELDVSRAAIWNWEHGEDVSRRNQARLDALDRYMLAIEKMRYDGFWSETQDAVLAEAQVEGKKFAQAVKAACGDNGLLKSVLDSVREIAKINPAHRLDPTWPRAFAEVVENVPEQTYDSWGHLSHKVNRLNCMDSFVLRVHCPFCGGIHFVPAGEDRRIAQRILDGPGRVRGGICDKALIQCSVVLISAANKAQIRAMVDLEADLAKKKKSKKLPGGDSEVKK